MANLLIIYDIGGVAKDWFHSYLDNRKQYVTLNGSNSSTKPILTGVPLESVLGPLLFLSISMIYVNVLSILKPIIMLQSHSSLENLVK